MKKQEIINEINKYLDILELSEAVFKKWKLDTEYLKKILNDGIFIASELNDGKLTLLKKFKYFQWKLRLQWLLENELKVKFLI